MKRDRFSSVLDLLVAALYVGTALRAVLAVFGAARPVPPFLVAIVAVWLAGYLVARWAIPALRVLFPKRWAVVIEVREVGIPLKNGGWGSKPWRVLNAPRFRRRKVAEQRAQVSADAWREGLGGQEGRVWVGEIDVDFARHYRSLRRVEATKGVES